MTWRALIMAGGSGTRMRDSGELVPKPLVRVAGTSLIERNVQQLIKFGFEEVIVSVSETAVELRTFLADRIECVARHLGVRLDYLVENERLGNMGCIRGLPRGGSTLVVFADNLTSLDLAALMSFHDATSDVAMTLATHLQPFTMPFGAVELEGGRILNYREKPTVDFSVSSGICVLGSSALEHCPRGRAFGMSDLVQHLLGHGFHIANYPHSAAWIDVNDQAQVAVAERLVMENWPSFEMWAPKQAGGTGNGSTPLGSHMPAVQVFDQIEGLVRTLKMTFDPAIPGALAEAKARAVKSPGLDA